MKKNKPDFENSSAYNDALRKYYQMKNKAWGMFFPFEATAWILGGAVDLFLIAAAGYGAHGFSEFFDAIHMALPTMGQWIVPALGISASRIGANAIMKHTILNKQKRWYTRNVYNQKKIDYVATHYKEGMDKIVALSKTKDMTKIKALAQQIKQVEKEANITPEEEKVITKKLEQHTQKIMQNLPVAERKRLADLFMSLDR